MRLRRASKDVVPCPPCRVEEILTQLAFVGAIVGTGTSNPDTTTAAILLKDLLCECENCQPTDALDAEEPAVSTHYNDSEAGSFEEWCVYGVPDPGEPYRFVWSPILNPSAQSGQQDAESAARAFVAMVNNAPNHSRYRRPWKDGPYIAKRTVVIGEWSAALDTEEQP